MKEYVVHNVVYETTYFISTLKVEERKLHASDFKFTFNYRLIISTLINYGIKMPEILKEKR